MRKSKKHIHIVILLTFILIIGFGCNFNVSVGKPKQPTNEELQKLVKATTADFTDSLEKDDFEIIRKKASTSFQQQFSAEKIKNSSSYFVERKNLAVPLFRATQTIQAELSAPPTMTETNEKYVLQTKGKFPGQAREIDFHFEYLREDGKWKLIKIEIKT